MIIERDLTKDSVAKCDGNCLTDEHLGGGHDSQVGDIHLKSTT